MCGATFGGELPRRGADYSHACVRTFSGAGVPAEARLPWGLSGLPKGKTTGDQTRCAMARHPQGLAAHGAQPPEAREAPGDLAARQVVETGSIVAASARLNLTQPGVTRRVQSLEQTLGIAAIFDQWMFAVRAFKGERHVE
jgi:hypothetical protein